MPKIERETILRCMELPRSQWPDGVRAFPIAAERGVVSAVGATTRLVGMRPAASVALEISRIQVTRIITSPVALGINFIRIIPKSLIDRIQSAGWVAAVDSPGKPVFLQAWTVGDQLAKSEIFAGETTVVADRTGAIYRSGDGQQGNAAAAPATTQTASPHEWFIPPKPVVLWGDDSSGLPGLVVWEANPAYFLRVNFYGREWPLDTEQY